MNPMSNKNRKYKLLAAEEKNQMMRKLPEGYKNYIVFWTYMANHGYNIIMAENPQKAIANHLYSRNPGVTLIAVEMTETAIISKGARR